MRKSNSSGRREETWRHASSSALNPGTHHHLCCITGIWLDFLAGREWQRMKEEREGEGLLSKRLMTQCHANLLKATGWWKAFSQSRRNQIFFASFLLRLSFVSWFFRGESKRGAWVIADRDSSIGSLCWYASTRSTNAPSLFAHWANKQKTVKNKRGNRRGNKSIKEEASCPHYQMSWRRTGVGSRKSGGVSWRIRKHTRLHYRVSISSSIICCRFFSPLLHPSNCNLAHDDWRGHWTRKKRYRRVNVWTTKVQTKSTNCFWLLLCLFPSPSATNDGYDTHDRTTK